MRRLRKPLLVAFAVTALLGVGVGVAFAAFSATTANPSNTFSAAPDFVPPSATSVIMRNGATVPGFLKAGLTYYAYANVTDTGNPASGVLSATADLSILTAGETARTMSTVGGPWTVAGTSYTRRSSAVLTSGGGLSAGAKAYTLNMADNASNSQVQAGFSVTIDNPAPTATDVQTTNHAGGTAGKLEALDTIIYTFSEGVEPGSILGGWDGTATTISAGIANQGASDDFTTPATNLGPVDLAANYAGGNRTIPNSTMVMSGNTVTITLGTPSGGTNTIAANTLMTWSPTATIVDYAGNAMSTTARAETGPADKDF